MFERMFRLGENGTTLRREVLAGATTFLTMAYIVFVNPDILSITGMDFGAVFTATCLAAVIGTLVMGLAANYPIALAPLMGENAFFATVVTLGIAGTRVSWETALATSSTTTIRSTWARSGTRRPMVSPTTPPTAMTRTARPRTTRMASPAISTRCGSRATRWS